MDSLNSALAAEGFLLGLDLGSNDRSRCRRVDPKEPVYRTEDYCFSQLWLSLNRWTT